MNDNSNKTSFYLFTRREEEEEVLMIHFIPFPTESKTEFQYSLPIHFLLKELRNPFHKMKTKKSNKIDLLLELSGLQDTFWNAR